MTRRSRVRVVVWLLILGAAAAPAGAQSDDARDSVHLTFGWPGDLEAQVSFEATRTRMRGGRPSTLAISGTYDLKTAAVEDGLLISTENARLDVAGAESGSQRAKIRELLLKAASTPPAYVVDVNGRYLRIEGLEQYRADMLGALDTLSAGAPDDMRVRLSQILSSLLTNETLAANMASKWNRDVGAWLDATLDRDNVYRAELSQLLPMLGNVEVPLVATFQFRERLPCEAGAAERTCVDLEMRTTVDSARLAEAMEAFLNRFAEGQEPKVERLRLDTSVRLVTEPRTLLPHRMTMTKMVSIAIRHDGKLREQHQTEEWRTLYVYR